MLQTQLRLITLNDRTGPSGVLAGHNRNLLLKLHGRHRRGRNICVLRSFWLMLKWML